LNILIVDEELISGGVKTIQCNLIPELSKLSSNLYWILPESRAVEFRTNFKDAINIQILSEPWYNSSLNRKILFCFKWSNFLKNKIRLISRTFTLRRLYKKWNIDVILTTCVFQQPPFPKGVFRVGVLCDLNPYGDLIKEFFKNLDYWKDNTEALIPISHFTKQQFIQRFPSYKCLLKAIPIAASRVNHYARVDPEENFIFYYPASIMPHKNHLVLLQVIYEIKSDYPSLQLILSGTGTEEFKKDGNRTESYIKKCRELISKYDNKFSPTVKIKGYIDESEIEELYLKAACVILPTGKEGYGLPFAEALSYGKPLICSDIEPFREQEKLYQAYGRVRFLKNNSKETLKSTIRDFLRNPITTLPKNEAKEMIGKWTYNHVAESYFRFFQNNKQ
jgi:glycosyltransferase involved in cell wall biosynthesis